MSESKLVAHNLRLPGTGKSAYMILLDDRVLLGKDNWLLIAKGELAAHLRSVTVPQGPGPDDFWSSIVAGLQASAPPLKEPVKEQPPTALPSPAGPPEAASMSGEVQNEIPGLGDTPPVT